MDSISDMLTNQQFLCPEWVCSASVAPNFCLYSAEWFGDDGADALRYLVATKKRKVVQRKLMGGCKTE